MAIATERLAPETLAARLDSVLSFPVTAFDASGGVALDRYREHVRTQIAARPAALFACCGTGEFFALDLDEYAALVRVAVEESAGRLPVVAGVGYGTALALRFAAAAEEAGADGLLVMPPYLVRASQRGLSRHYETLADATPLGLIVYLRDNAILTPDTVAELARHRTIIGLKDGHGDLDLLQRIITAVRADESPFIFLNGMPTAEMSSLAYRGLGVTTYSSAVLCFAPEIALAFNRALEAGDQPAVSLLLTEFYAPLVALRHRGHGYAISLVKAGVRLRGLDVGEVRSPLSEPEPEHLSEFSGLLERGLKAVESM